jgi:hypothetical protein
MRVFTAHRRDAGEKRSSMRAKVVIFTAKTACEKTSTAKGGTTR